MSIIVFVPFVFAESSCASFRKDKNCTNSAESEKFHLENLVESSNVANFATEEESSNTFTPIFIDPTTDFGFKRLFGSLLREAVMTVNGTNEILTDKMKAFIIELTEIKGKSEKDCKTRLEKWVYNIINMYSMTKELAFKDEMPIFNELEYYSRISKMTPEEYQEYQANLKRERDNYAVMEGAVVQERLKNAKAMKEYGVPFEIIAKGFNLTLEEVQGL